MNKNVIAVVAVVLVIAAGLLFFSQRSTAPQQEAPQQTQTETTEPEISPETGDATMEEEEGSTVNVTTAGYSPAEVTVKVGEEVTWVNNTDTTVNVSSAVHPTHRVYPPLNLGDFGPGESVSLVFDTAGTYRYHNHLNPSQTGTVVVE